MRKHSAFAISILSVGCMGVSTNASLMDPSIHLARTCPAAVKLYTMPDRVNAEYLEVAVLNSTGLTRYSGEDDLIESMRKKAASVGANGIILGGIDEPSAMVKVATEVANVVTGEAAAVSPERKGRAVAIYVSADSTNAAAACAKKE